MLLALPLRSVPQNNTAAHKPVHARPPATKAKPTGSTKKTTQKRNTKAVPHSNRKNSYNTARSLRLKAAFHATEQLRPMAQQLLASRTPAAYSGVLAYAKAHPGEGAAAAYLALGHARMLDRQYPEAENMFRLAAKSGGALSDYADYLGAQAAIQAERGDEAYTLLNRFAERHPDSIFVDKVPVLLANAHLQQNDPQGALRVLTPLADTPQARQNDFRYALARAYQLTGDKTHAAPVFRSIVKDSPLSTEADQAKTQLDTMGIPLTARERRARADQLFNAKRYNDAGAEYRAIRNDPGLGQADRDALAIYAAASELRQQKHISRSEVERLPTTQDDSAALKLYLLAETSRDEGDTAGHRAILQQMMQRFPTSRWLEEALYSGGNMYLLKRDSGQAIYHYATLVEMFPKSRYAPSAHWRAAWMNYRLRNYPEAARLMDEQLQRYAGGIEISPALYWRGRIYEEVEHNPAQAANYYRTLVAAHANYYYANLAQKRLSALGTQPKVALATPLSSVHAPAVPSLIDELPENEPHLIKARLVANAALNEYIPREIQASPTASEWGTLAQAEIYDSFGETARALQSMKRSNVPFFAIPLNRVPAIYWQLLLPRPYWQQITANSARYGLDPYLVASLIRQESEFNPQAVSRAKAYGLMQMLASVGKAQARKQGMKNFTTSQLLNPSVNMQLGTMYLKDNIDRYGGQVEYALAAYNAGDTPVRKWIAEGNYKDIAEFVESIPYTETREYVQSILRNQQAYDAFYSKQ